MVTQNDGGFRCIKITLTVLYSLALVIYVIGLTLSIIGLIAAYQAHPEKVENKIEITRIREALIVWIIALALGLILTIVGLVGTVKEHLGIVVAITVLNTIGVVYYFVVGSYLNAIMGIGSVALTGIYAYMIHSRDKLNRAV